MIIQGGILSKKYGYGNTAYNVTYPLEFPSRCIGVTPCIESDGPQGGNITTYAKTRTNREVTIVLDSSNAPYTVDVFYIAFGL